MALQTNWHVIAGGVANGKTTLINLLSRLGYATVPEAARTIIDEGLARGETLAQIRGDENAWQQKILQRILGTEAKLDPSSLIFFDRGAHDGLAHLESKGVTPGKYWDELTNHPRQPYYKTVFLLDPLPEFEHDHVRTENAQTAKLLNELTAKVYMRFGMKPIHIPSMPPEQRLQLILSHLHLSSATIDTPWQEKRVAPKA